MLSAFICILIITLPYPLVPPPRSPPSHPVLLELAHGAHGGAAGHVGPLPRRRQLHAVLVPVRVIGLPLPPAAEGGHGGPVHVAEVPLALRVLQADVSPGQAGLSEVGRQQGIGGRVPGHGQVAPPGLAEGLRLGEAPLLLHQQVDLAVRLLDASDRCGGGQG